MLQLIRKLIGRRPKSHSASEKFYLNVDRFRLKQRTKNACQDQIDYEQQLRQFCLYNRNNQKVLVEITGLRQYFILNLGYSERDAAKQILDYYSSNNL